MESYYREIHNDEWADLVRDRVEVGEDLFSNIKEFISTNEYKFKVDLSQRNMRIQLTPSSIFLFHNYENSISDIGIDILPDEWFLIHYHNNKIFGKTIFYECDQIDGLYKFLSDLIGGKINN